MVKQGEGGELEVQPTSGPTGHSPSTTPRNGIVEIAGPERAPFNEIVARYLKAVGDPREAVRDPEARYWAAGSRSVHWCRWARRASAALVWRNGFAAHAQEPDPASASPHPDPPPQAGEGQGG